MKRLAALQQALLATLFESDPKFATENLAAYACSDWSDGLFAYQANSQALAQRALRAAYPVLAQLLGDDNFDALARRFWHTDPPRRGDLAQWGDTLAAFVAGLPQLQDEPYLPDVARLEWALHQAACAADVPFDPASFALLTQHDPAQVGLRLAPACAVLCSHWPVYSIVQAHRQPDGSLQTAAQRLQAGVAECTLLWRQGWQPQLRMLHSAEARWVQALLDGQSVLATLQHLNPAAGEAALDLTVWLPMAAQAGLLMGAFLLPPSTQRPQGAQESLA